MAPKGNSEKKEYAMNSKKLAAIVAIIAASGLAVRAQDSTTAPPATDQPDMTAPAQPSQLFRAKELDLDMFGTVSVNEDTVNHLSATRVRHNGRLGAGAGLTYYYLRWIGVGAEAYSENTAHSFIDDASANLYLRLPLESVHLAPYIYGGGGHELDPIYSWFGQFGGGVDIRLTPHFSLFVDARYVLPEHGDNFGLGRVGIRIPF